MPLLGAQRVFTFGQGEDPSGSVPINFIVGGKRKTRSRNVKNMCISSLFSDSIGTSRLWLIRLDHNMDPAPLRQPAQKEILQNLGRT